MKKTLLLSAILFLGSCGHAVVQHPGALNSFDNYAYDTLRVEEVALNQAKTTLPQFPALQKSFDTIKVQYNDTIAAYKVYHLALLAGKNPDTAALDLSIKDLIVKVGEFLKATGVVQ